MSLDISVIIPMYNREMYIEKCVMSALQQTIKNKEIICVDNGSTDNTVHIVKELQNKYKEIKLICLKENYGAGYARNVGINAAAGEYIAFLDSDDTYYDITALEKMVEISISNNISVCGAFTVLNNNNNMSLSPIYRNIFNDKIMYKKVKFFDIQNIYCHCSHIFKRSFIIDNEMYYPTLSRFEDPVFLMEVMIKAKEFIVVPVDFYSYRINKGEKNDYTDKELNDMLIGMEKIIKYSLKYNLIKIIQGCIKRININYYSSIKKSISAGNYELMERISLINNMILNIGENLKITAEYNMLKNDDINNKKEIIESSVNFYNYIDIIKETIKRGRSNKYNEKLFHKYHMYFLFLHNCNDKLFLCNDGKEKLLSEVKNVYRMQGELKIQSYMNNWGENTNVDIKKLLCGNIMACDEILNRKEYIYNVLFKGKLYNKFSKNTVVRLKHGMYYMNYLHINDYEILNHDELPLCICEDGFIRSIVPHDQKNVDVRYRASLSAVFDYNGIYINAKSQSMLECLLNSDWKISDKDLKRSRALIDKIIKNKISKYNHIITGINIGRNGYKKVLIIDQVYGDQSIRLGLADDEMTFKIMLQDAIRENPNADIIIKAHPVRNKGHYADIKSHDNIYVLTEGINPICLLEKMDKVYVCTSQMGFEALMCGKEVHTYGMPFYAGWGLTIDKLKCERRTKKRSLEEVFHAAYIQYSRYISWKNQCETDIEHVIDEILELREEYFSKYGENSRMKNNTLPSNKSIGYYHCFPFNNIPKNSKVIIYGMGEVGRHYLKQIRLTNYCDVEFATDGNWQNIDYVDVKMVPPEEIAKSNSIIVIANGNAGAANEIKSKLLSLGITESRIIWNDMIISEAMVTDTLVGNTNKKLGHYHIFPFANIKKGEQIIIWGMGEVGRHYVKQLQKTGYASINFAVDSNWKNINNAPVNTFSTDILKSKVNAKIVIANGNAGVADKIIQQLKAWGYSDDQIVWNDLIVSESLVVQGATSSKSTVPAKVSLPEPKKVISENSNTDKRGNVLIKAPVDKLNVVLEQVLKSQKDIEIVFS